MSNADQKFAELRADLYAAAASLATTQMTPRHRRFVRGTPRIAAIVAVIVATVSVGTVFALQSGGVSIDRPITCYDSTAREGGIQRPATDAASPRSVCASLWADGLLGNTGSTRSASIPPLVACAQPNGNGVAVIPTADSCSTFGLADLPDDYAARVAKFVPLRASIARDLHANNLGGVTTCVTLKAAEQLTVTELDAHGYGDWTVVPGGRTAFGPGTPCAFPRYDEARHLVILHAVSNPAPNPAPGAVVRAISRIAKPHGWHVGPTARVESSDGFVLYRGTLISHVKSTAVLSAAGFGTCAVVVTPSGAMRGGCDFGLHAGDLRFGVVRDHSVTAYFGDATQIHSLAVSAGFGRRVRVPIADGVFLYTAPANQSGALSGAAFEAEVGGSSPKHFPLTRPASSTGFAMEVN